MRFLKKSKIPGCLPSRKSRSMLPWKVLKFYFHKDMFCCTVGQNLRLLCIGSQLVSTNLSRITLLHCTL